ncbi:protein of unknown function (plasmid) [Rhodovastum atsumiense]|nr:protein of unknown function [Rhodovastum atsumiense]
MSASTRAARSTSISRAATLPFTSPAMRTDPASMAPSTRPSSPTATRSAITVPVTEPSIRRLPAARMVPSSTVSAPITVPGMAGPRSRMGGPGGTGNGGARVSASGAGGRAGSTARAGSGIWNDDSSNRRRPSKTISGSVCGACLRLNIGSALSILDARRPGLRGSFGAILAAAAQVTPLV